MSEQMRRHFSKIARGFTLIEASVTTVILGVGFVAVLELFGTTTRQLRAADAMTAGAMLADHVREMTETLAFNDPQSGSLTFGRESNETNSASIDDLDDFRMTGPGNAQTTFSPPVDSSRVSLTDFSGFRQTIRVEPVNPNNLNTVLTVGPFRALRVTVTVQKLTEMNQWQTVHTVTFCRFE